MTTHFHKGQRVRARVAFMGVEVGDLGTVEQAEDYVPGLDAGNISVWPDTFPEASHYGHNAVSHWTDGEALHYWEPIPTPGQER